MKAFVCALGAILATIMSAAPAAPLDVTFDDLMSAGNPLVTVLDTHGYRFTGAFRTIDTPGGIFVSNGSAVYLAQPAGRPGITVSRADGGPFGLYEFEAAGLIASPAAGSSNAQQVSLIARQAGGTMLGASFGFDRRAGFSHVTVPSSWSNLQFVTLSGLTAAGMPGGLALDDIGVGTRPDSPVPEPGTLVLFVTTALGGGAMLLNRRRRSGPSSRRR